jgi:transglutaminase-like putative cysteine protease
MVLSIRHTTRYTYTTPLSYSLQRLRLWPSQGDSQKIVDWNIEIEGAKRELSYRDHFGNETWLLSSDDASEAITVTATGTMDTKDTSGIAKFTAPPAPLWLFERDTELTAITPSLAEFRPAPEANEILSWLHDLMAALHEKMDYLPDTTVTTTTASEALAAGQGVCQDYSHIFCAIARAHDIPARYVSGYLLLDDRIEQDATHAWAEAHVAGIGWIGFDAVNNVCPDQRYVRLACGLDYRDAAPISGIRLGTNEEALAVTLTVEQ